MLREHLVLVNVQVAKSATQVFTNPNPGNRTVFHVCRVRFKVNLGKHRVKRALKIPKVNTQIPAVALVAPLVGPRKRTVPNARRAGRVRSAMVATIARWVMQDTAEIAMRHNANNVHWVKQPRFEVRPRAMGAIWARTAVPKVYVRLVQPVNTKMAKVKHHAKSATQIPT